MTLRDGFSLTPVTTTSFPAFKVPESLKVQDYPRVICDFEKHVRRLQRKLAEETKLCDAKRDLLHSIEWHGSGTNDKQRDSRFKVLLAANPEYQELEQFIFDLTWHIKDEEAEMSKLIGENINARLRYRSAMVATELFAGVPINPHEDD